MRERIDVAKLYRQALRQLPETLDGGICSTRLNDRFPV